jgi:hypothetical protein
MHEDDSMLSSSQHYILDKFLHVFGAPKCSMNGINFKLSGEIMREVS